MAQSIREVMTKDPITLTPDSSVVDAAKAMRDADVGPALIAVDGGLQGIVTDRDLAVRVVAEGRDPSSTKVSEIASTGLATLTPDDSVEDAIKIIREQKVRRIPIVENNRPVGIVAIGDLAVERDSDSALADISAADPNN